MGELNENFIINYFQRHQSNLTLEQFFIRFQADCAEHATRDDHGRDQSISPPRFAWIWPKAPTGMSKNQLIWLITAVCRLDPFKSHSGQKNKTKQLNSVTKATCFQI